MHVAHAIVPVVVIVPPVIGLVVAMEVTVAGAPPSVRVQVVPELVQVTIWPVVGTTVNPAIVLLVVAPLVNIVWAAAEPLAICRLPAVVLSTPSTGAAVYAGVPELEVLLPKTVPPAALVSEKLRAGVVVGFATLVVNNGESVPALKLVTDPAEAATQAS